MTPSLHLSLRQVEVCILVVARDDSGRFYTDKGIARELGIKVRSVETYMDRAASAIRRAYPHLARSHGSPRRIIHEWYWLCRHEALARTARRAA